MIYLWRGIQEILQTCKHYELIGALGYQDIILRYRRSFLGPLWITLSTGVMVSLVGYIFSKALDQPFSQFLPYLTIGLVTWFFISTTIQELAFEYIANPLLIQESSLPIPITAFRLLWRNSLIYFHNLLLIPAIYLVVGYAPSGFEVLLVIPGLLLLMANLAWVSQLLSLLSVRFQDLPNIVTSSMPVFLYATPILWPASKLAPDNPWFITLNPVYHVIECLRSPLLGQLPTTLNWTVSITGAIIGWLITLMFIGRYRHRVVFWL